MDTREIHRNLNDLMHLDVDAVRAYGEAIAHIDDAEIRGRLQQYRDDHQRHVDDLRAVIAGIGGEAEEPRPDAKGMLLEVMAKLRSALGEQQALRAIYQNEEITNKQYRDAVEWNVPDDVREVLDRGYADEQRHIAYIEEELRIFAGSSAR